MTDHTDRPKPSIGFIGLGTMGSAMAENLIDAGHPLTVFDLRPEAGEPHVAKGAMWADSPAAVAASCDVVLLSLPGPSQVSDVVLGTGGVAEGARADLTVFDLSTNSPTVVRDLHAQLSPRGVHLLDAPVSGGPDGARNGRLAIWVGGDRARFDSWLGLLQSFGDAPHYVGDIGAGSVAKLVHNLSGYVIQTALAEVMTMGVKAGVPADVLWESIRYGAHGRRRTYDGLSRNLLPGRFDPPDFALALAHKDVSLACELARQHGVPMRLAALTLDEMTEALNRGWAGRDSRSAMLLQEERAGVEVRAPAERIAEILADD